MANLEKKAEGEARREAIVEFLRGYVGEHGYAPSQREIAAAVGVAGPTVVRHLRKLQQEGKIRLGPGPRMIAVLDDAGR